MVPEHGSFTFVMEVSDRPHRVVVVLSRWSLARLTERSLRHGDFSQKKREPSHTKSRSDKHLAELSSRPVGLGVLHWRMTRHRNKSRVRGQKVLANLVAELSPHSLAEPLPRGPLSCLL